MGRGAGGASGVEGGRTLDYLGALHASLPWRRLLSLQPVGGYSICCGDFELVAFESPLWVFTVVGLAVIVSCKRVHLGFLEQPIKRVCAGSIAYRRGDSSFLPALRQCIALWRVRETTDNDDRTDDILAGTWIAFRAKVIGRKFVRDVGVLTIANGVAAVLSFMTAILVARWLGPELYGVAALLMSYPSVVYTLFDARSPEASVKYLSEFHARGERERVLAMCKLGYVVDVAIAARGVHRCAAYCSLGSAKYCARARGSWPDRRLCRCVYSQRTG